MRPSYADRHAHELRRAFHYFNHVMVLLWRLGLGDALNRGPRISGRYMVLIHVGRRTGLRRRTPVNFALLDGEPHCLAGFGAESDWYRNIVAHPTVEVWMPDGWWAGRATTVTDPAKRLAALREVLLASGFAASLAGVDPRRISDDGLTERMTNCPVVRITRTHARTGPGGPGDLILVWPLAIGLALAMRRRARQCRHPQG